MFKIRWTIMLMALTYSGVCLPECSSMQAGQPAPPILPGEREANSPDKKESAKVAIMPAEEIEKMFPDGIVHNFGIMPRGMQGYHAFRVVNPSNVPLRILSVRLS